MRSADKQHDRHLVADAIGLGLVDRYAAIALAPLPAALQTLLDRLAVEAPGPARPPAAAAGRAAALPLAA
jgi:hypothetical protein